MLLWILLMALATCLVAFTQRKNEALNARIQCTMLAVIGVFCAFVLTVSNPFLRNLPAVPSEGRDLNPILQDIGMILHPPVIFAAYAGLAVIFAVIVAVLWQKRMSPQAVSSLKRIGIVTWIFLTAGNALGSWWAYTELGWGGWWFWDPVENASFIPWLCAVSAWHLHCSKRSDAVGACLCVRSGTRYRAFVCLHPRDDSRAGSLYVAH